MFDCVFKIAADLQFGVKALTNGGPGAVVLQVDTGVDYGDGQPETTRGSSVYILTPAQARAVGSALLSAAVEAK